MKSIAIDFKNKRICIMAEGQNGTEHLLKENAKELLKEFIPDSISDRNSFTWNFENDTVSGNQDFTLPDGCIMSADNFVPEVILPIKGLSKHWSTFYKILGYEEIQAKEIIPEELRKFFGLE